MDDIYRSQFRLPYSLYEQLKASADKNHRSVNAELVARLETGFIADDLALMEEMSGADLDAIDRFGAPSVEDRLATLEQQLQQIIGLLQKE